MLGRASDLAAIGEMNLHQVGRGAVHAGRDPLRAIWGQDEITGLKRLNRHAAGRRAHQRPGHKAGVTVLVLDDVVGDELADLCPTPDTTVVIEKVPAFVGPIPASASFKRSGVSSTPRGKPL